MCVSILQYLGKKGTGGFDCLVVPDAITTNSGPVGVLSPAVPAQVCNWPIDVHISMNFTLYP